MTDEPADRQDTVDLPGTEEIAPADPGQVTATFPPAANDPTATASLQRPGTLGAAPEGAAPSAGTVDFAASGATVDHAPVGSVDAAAVLGGSAGASRTGGAGGAGPGDAPRVSIAGYEVLGTLGRGAMGVVYKARQRGLKRVVALKMILAGDHASAGDLARFQSEAEAVAGLQHPNIVQLYEVGEHEGRPYFSLEFVTGGSLAGKLKGEPQPPRRAAEVACDLALAMDYAHLHGVIHRDLKPANVLLTEDGTPKITDFGLAKRVEDDSAHTQSGTILGTPSYMSPEQAEGKIKDVGPLADVYTLGAILYELLTGRPPFKGTTILETLEMVRRKEPVPPSQLQPGVPRDLETVCLKCLQKEPHKRYPSAGELAEDLRRFLGGEPIKARPVGVAERGLRWCRRNPLVAALTGGIALAVSVGAIGSFYYGIEAHRQKGVADEQRDAALKARGEAEDARGVAEEKKLLAEKNEQLAKDREASIREGFQKYLSQNASMVSNLERALAPRKDRADVEPQLRPIRQEALKVVMDHLKESAATIDQSGATSYATVKADVDMAKLLRQYGHGREAMSYYDLAAKALKDIADKNPDDLKARLNMAVVLREIGDMKTEVDGDSAASAASYAEAARLQRDVLPLLPRGEYTPLQVKGFLVTTALRQGAAAVRLGDPAAARGYYQQALAFQEEVVGGAKPEKLDAERRQLANIHHALGDVAWRLGDLTATHDHYGRCLVVFDELTKRYRGDVSLKFGLSNVYTTYGDVSLRLGQPGEARRRYEQALPLAQELVKLSDTSVLFRCRLALTYYRLGAVAAREGRAGDARKQFADALELLQRPTVEPLTLPQQAIVLVTLARCGRHAEAAKLAEDIRKQAGRNEELLQQVACGYALCAAAAEDAGLKGQYAGKAIEALRAAVGPAFKDAAALETEPDLEPVRGRPEFQQLIATVKARRGG